MLEYKFYNYYNDGLVDVWVRNLADAWDWDFLATVPKYGWLDAARKIWDAL